MPRPGDFFIGVLDFFAVILPGAALVYVIQPSTTRHIPLSLQPSGAVQAWITFVILAYIVGHLLHAAASLLDKPVYNHWYLRRFQRDHFNATILIGKGADLQGDDRSSTLVARAYGYAGSTKGTSLYEWCLSFVRIYNAAAAGEIDRHQADSKFFRSFSIVAFMCLPIGLLFTSWPARVVVFLMAAIVSIFAIWRYCNLRWSATKKLYEYYILLNLYPDARRVTPPTPSAD